MIVFIVVFEKMKAGGGDTWTQVKLNLWKGVLVKRKKPVSETNEIIICALKIKMSLAQKSSNILK